MKPIGMSLRLSSAILSWGVLAVAGCNKQADLGNSSAQDDAFCTPTVPQYASAPPSFAADGGSTTAYPIVSGELDIGAFSIGQGQLAWFSSVVPGCKSLPSPTQGYQLSLCDVANCAGTVQSWPASEQNDTADWTKTLPVSSNLVAVLTGEEAMLRCRGEACSASVAVAGDYGGFPASWTVASLYLVDGATLYWRISEQSIGRCQIASCKESTLTIPVRGPMEGSTGFVGLLATDDVYLYLWGTGGIARLAKDGPYRLESGEPIDYEPVIAGRTSVSSAILHAYRFYWAEPAGIMSRQKEGATSEPQLVMPWKAMRRFVVDDEHVYVLGDPEGNGDKTARIVRCAVSGCLQPDAFLVDAQLISTSAVVDDQYLYFTGSAWNAERPRYIAAIAK